MLSLVLGLAELGKSHNEPMHATRETHAPEQEPWAYMS
jgi:hypothetical protein